VAPIILVGTMTRGLVNQTQDLMRAMECQSRAALASVLLSFIPQIASAASNLPAESALEASFEQHCAVCHDNVATRAPSRASLRVMSPAFIVDALTNGLMKAQGSGLTADERIALAEYLTGRNVGAESPMAGKCAGSGPPLALDSSSYNGWGAGAENWRFQPSPGLGAADLPRLELKWAFGVPDAAAMFGQPTVAGARVFFGAQNGHVYALDMRTGCYYWDYRASAGVRTAITVARVGSRTVALFGDRRGHAYSVDAATGETVWKATPDDEAATQITGAPALFESRLYVPISVRDEDAAIDPKFECCKGRGAVVALDAATGDVVWKTAMVPEAAPQGRNSAGAQLYGPSGASVWAAPTIDAKRRVLYVGTGDNHSAPATETSDAVMALSLDEGKVVWSRQLLAGDVGNVACLATDKTNCPDPRWPDLDFGSSANLLTLETGKRVLTIGQKSGVVWALDPDDGGRIVWSRRVSAGGRLGGVEWGTATDGKTVYVAVSDLAYKDFSPGKPRVLDPGAGGGLQALDPANGALRWKAPPAHACEERPNCSPAQSAAVTATREFVLSGSVDGHIRAYSTTTGRVLWDYDMERPFETVNAVAASGGSLDSAGPTVAGGMIFVNSGYGLHSGQSGNVLAAFAPKP
jgi:polyvinyl alcohol dehydrogenase (cytochrome)